MRSMTPIGGGDADIVLSISSDGYKSIASRRIANAYYPSANVSTVVNAMVTLMADDGITAGTITAGPTLSQYQVIYKSVKEILDDMAKVAGYVWTIDSNKQLQFIPQEPVTTAFASLNETSGSFTDYHDLSFQSSLDNYSNKVFVIGGVSSGIQIVAVRENTTEITNRQILEGGSGVYGIVVQDSNLKTVADAENVGDKHLAKTSTPPSALSFSTYTYGFRPGDKLTVTLPSFFGYSGPFNSPVTHYYLIEQVQIDKEDASTVKYSISATRRSNSNFSTQKADGFKEYFEQIVKK
jgi:hypothetical protein